MSSPSRSPRTRRAVVASVVAVAGALAPSAPAHALDATVTSFDGTAITTHFYPAAGLPDGATAPTVLQGPGWSSPGSTNPDAATDPGNGVVGLGPLRRAGYNVLTWDPRGFGSSGGQVNIDGPDFEGRDTQALLDFVAARPEARLDAAGDPRVGMTGGSYGGGIQTVTAGIDRRIDAIVPAISWNSLQTSLYKDDTYKTGFSTLLLGLGNARGRLNPIINQAAASATSTGTLTPGQREYFVSRGPGATAGAVTAPTLIVQGTTDVLFTLQEAAANYALLRQAGTPVKMLWFCGGHSGCPDAAGDTSLVESRSLAWLDRYVKGDTAVDTGPGFTFPDQLGTTHATTAYPPAAATPLTAEGSGTLPLTAVGSAGTSPLGPARATNAVDVPIVAAAPAQLAGAPQLSLTYSGRATASTTRVFAQLVDEASGRVVNNAITPIPVTLDGATHTIERPLELVSAALIAGQRLTLQLVASSGVYDPQRAVGSVDVARAALSLPAVDLSQPAPELPVPAGEPGTGTTTTTAPTTPVAPTTPATVPAAVPTPTPGTSPPAAVAPCTSRRAVTLHVRSRYRARLVSARVLVGGRRVATVGRSRAARISFASRAEGTVRATIVMRLRGGRTVRDVRTFRLCVPASLAARRR